MFNKLIFFISLILLTGCISSRKYNEMVLLKDHYKQEADQLKLVQQQKEELQQKLADKEEEVKDTRDQLAKLSGRFVQLEEGNTDLSGRYDQLLKEHQGLIRQSELEERRLLDSIQFLHGRIEEKNTEIRRLQLEYTKDPAEADSLLEHLSVRELELREFRESRDREDEALQELQQDLAKSLRSWPDTVLGWRLENRQIQISMRNDWLFEDNGTELSGSGAGQSWRYLLDDAVFFEETLAVDILVEDFPAALLAYVRR